MTHKLETGIYVEFMQILGLRSFVKKAPLTHMNKHAYIDTCVQENLSLK